MLNECTLCCDWVWKPFEFLLVKIECMFISRRFKSVLIGFYNISKNYFPLNCAVWMTCWLSVNLKFLIRTQSILRIIFDVDFPNWVLHALALLNRWNFGNFRQLHWSIQKIIGNGSVGYCRVVEFPHLFYSKTGEIHLKNLILVMCSFSIFFTALQSIK